MDARLAALRADKNSLCEELSVTRRMIHTASRKAERIRHATSRAWCLLPLMLDTMLNLRTGWVHARTRCGLLAAVRAAKALGSAL